MRVILSCPKKSYQAGLACFHPKLTLGNVSSLFLLVLMDFVAFQQVSNLIQILTGITNYQPIPYFSQWCHSSVFTSQTAFRKLDLYLTSVSSFGMHTSCRWRTGQPWAHEPGAGGGWLRDGRLLQRRHAYSVGFCEGQTLVSLRATTRELTRGWEGRRGGGQRSHSSVPRPVEGRRSRRPTDQPGSPARSPRGEAGSEGWGAPWERPGSGRRARPCLLGRPTGSVRLQ